MSDHERRTRTELRLLRTYLVVSTTLLGGLALAAFRRAGERPRFGEIDVQRINVVEPDGKLRMVISNKARSTGPIAYGKPFGYKGGTRPGIIFFNDEETEDGGLVFEGKKENGKYAAGAQLSFDQYDQDQVVYLTYEDENGTRSMGLNIADRADVPITELVAAMDSVNRMPAGPAKDEARRRLFAPRHGVPQFARRVFIGRDPSRAAVLRLSDPLGRPRLRLVVDSAGAARIEFLDESGRVVQRLPDTTHAKAQEPGGS